MLARQMEVYAGFLEHTDHHVGRLVDALDDLGVLEDTLVYYIIGDNGASAEGTLNGTLQRDDQLQRRRGARRRPSSWSSASTTSARRRRTTTTPSAGRTRWTRPTSGPSRSPRTGAARATARSCTGRSGIDAPGARSAPVPPRHRRRPDRSSKRPGCPQPTSVNGVAADADRGREHGATRSTTRARPERHETQYFEMFCNRGIYHKGWTAVTRHATPWMVEPELPAVRRRRLGALRHEHRLDARRTTSPPSMPEKLAELQRSVRCSRRAQVQRAPARRPQSGAREPRISPADRQLRARQHAGALPGMRRLSENSVINTKNKWHSVSAEVEIPSSGASGVTRRAGRQTWVDGLSTPTRGGLGHCYNFLGLLAVRRHVDVARRRRARTRCGWSLLLRRRRHGQRARGHRSGSSEAAWPCRQRTCRAHARPVLLDG